MAETPILTLKAARVSLLERDADFLTHLKETEIRAVPVLHLSAQTNISTTGLSPIRNARVGTFPWASTFRGAAADYERTLARQTLEESGIKEWFCAIPNPIWESEKARRSIWKALRLAHSRESKMKAPRAERRRFTTNLAGTNLTIAPLSAYSSPASEIALIIDVDYLTGLDFSRKPIPVSQLRKSLPWIWPDELLAFFSEKNIKIAAASINAAASSVRFKFLGEALASALSGKGWPEGYETIKEAMIQRARGNDQAALDLLSACHCEGTFAAARAALRAQIFYDADYRDDAVREYAKAASIDPEYSTLRSHYAWLYDAWKMPQEAFEEHRMMKTLYPDSPESHAGEARFLASRNKTEEAIAKYEELLALHPRRAKDWFDLGELYLKAKNLIKAKICFSKALEIYPNEALPHTALGKVFYRERDYKISAIECREAIVCGDATARTFWLLAKNYWRIGKKRHSALAAFEALLLSASPQSHR